MCLCFVIIVHSEGLIGGGPLCEWGLWNPERHSGKRNFLLFWGCCFSNKQEGNYPVPTRISFLLWFLWSPQQGLWKTFIRRALESVWLVKMIPFLSLLIAQFTTSRGLPLSKTQMASFVFHKPCSPLWTFLCACDPVKIVKSIQLHIFCQSEVFFSQNNYYIKSEISSIREIFVQLMFLIANFRFQIAKPYTSLVNDILKIIKVNILGELQLKYIHSPP